MTDNKTPAAQAVVNHKSAVKWLTIDDDQAGQRIDNFLFNQLKNVPKSAIYRLLRKGEVRVNKKRVKAEYKLQADDVLRIPPLTVSQATDNPTLPNVKLHQVETLQAAILYEDDELLVLNKPAGLAVHGGSGLSFGVIEGLRALRPQARFLELVHRLDRETSGILLVAKKRSALRALHEQLRQKTVTKRYLALVHGQWPTACRQVQAPLLKNTLQSGERLVRVDATGKPSKTDFQLVQRFAHATLIKAMPVTGRTHQIRVHCQYTGHPIAGDSRYSDDLLQQQARQWGVTRLFLHAQAISFLHPRTGKQQQIEAPLPNSLQQILANLASA